MTTVGWKDWICCTAAPLGIRSQLIIGGFARVKPRPLTSQLASSAFITCRPSSPVAPVTRMRGGGEGSSRGNGIGTCIPGLCATAVMFTLLVGGSLGLGEVLGDGEEAPGRPALSPLRICLRSRARAASATCNRNSKAVICWRWDAVSAIKSLSLLLESSDLLFRSLHSCSSSCCFCSDEETTCVSLRTSSSASASL